MLRLNTLLLSALVLNSVFVTCDEQVCQQIGCGPKLAVVFGATDIIETRTSGHVSTGLMVAQRV